MLPDKVGFASAFCQPNGCDDIRPVDRRRQPISDDRRPPTVCRSWWCHGILAVAISIAILLCSVILPTPAPAAPLDGDGRPPTETEQNLLAESLCDAAPSFCDCSDQSTSPPTVVHTIEGQFVDPTADERVAHLVHCGEVATAVFRRSYSEASGEESPGDWRLLALHRGVHTKTCRRLDFHPGTDRLICHRALEGDTWRIGFFHALAFTDDGLERRQLTNYTSNARGCPTDVLRTEHPLGWRTWHRPDDPRSALVTIFFQHRNGRVPDSHADACQAMHRGNPVFGPKRRVTEYFEWADGRFTFAGATRMLDQQTRASWITPERLDAPICRRREAVEQIQKKRDTLRRCYAEAMSEGKLSAGILKLKWTVGAEGTVESTEVVTDSIESKSLAKCIRNVIEKMEFVPPRGGDQCSFVYPFAFTEAENK